MHIHSPSCLEGPISAARDWWREADLSSVLCAEPIDLTSNSASQDEDPTFRADLVARVRREIAAGRYDTPEQWERALDRLMDRLEQHDA